MIVRLQRVRTPLLLLGDASFLTIALMGAIWLRFEVIPAEYLQFSVLLLGMCIPVSLGIFSLLGLYNRSLRFTSLSDMLAVFNAVTFASTAKLAVVFFHHPQGFSRSVMILDWVLALLLIGGFRILPRILMTLAFQEPLRSMVYGEIDKGPRRVLIVGAGRAGESVAREIRRNEFLPFNLIGFIDDAKQKKGSIIHGAKVFGGRECLTQVIAEQGVDEVIIALPSASGETVREIVRLCRNTTVKFQTLPGLQDILEGKLLSMQLREISVEDLLRRPPAEVNLAEIAAYITGKTVLVTGAGGSIGSEICRQILPFQPVALLLLGQGENSIYQVNQDLREHPDLGATRLVPLIGDIKDTEKIGMIFKDYKPQIIFHAAAHKHVPLMESNPEEAVKNNVLGTMNLVRAAHETEAERFVMISTDKAVNPTSVMGASKRVAEKVLKCYAKRSATRFCAVRFGNVLGSRGSVIPLFKKQIEKGGPITVTHPNMIRYFMTIPEASRLVIQAGAFGKGGEVFVLDMGEPVRIADLASDLIRLSGLEEGRDIEIKYTGIRPGEKLYEEILTAEEGIAATRNKKIFIAKPEVVDEEVIMPAVKTLIGLALEARRPLIIEHLVALIPNFSPDRDQIYNKPKHHAGELDVRQLPKKLRNLKVL